MELRLDNIVVGYDFSDGATHALEATIWLARRVHADVRVVTAIPGGPARWNIKELQETSTRNPLEIEALILEEVERLARERVALLKPGLVRVTFEVGEKRPEALLREVCDMSDADMIVVGAVGQEADMSVPIGTDTYRLIRHSMWPVMVVKRNKRIPPRHILTAVDMSDASERALGWGVDMARLTEAELTVLHVIEGKTTEAEFAEWLEAHDTSRIRYVHRVVRRGVAHREIIAHAQEENFDLLTIGSLGRSRLMELMIGGTSERVLRTLPCSMLFVKPVTFVLKR